MKVLRAFKSTIFQAVVLLGRPPCYAVWRQRLIFSVWLERSHPVNTMNILDLKVKGRWTAGCVSGARSPQRKRAGKQGRTWHFFSPARFRAAIDPKQWTKVLLCHQWCEILWERVGGWMQENLDHRRFGGMDGSFIYWRRVGLIKWFVLISISHDCQPTAGSHSSVSAGH